MTFAATAEVGLYFKARPVLVDCRRDTFNLDPDQIEQAIMAKTKAIVPVHTAGQACDMDRILEIAIDHDLRVIEDAAHAFPARFQGKMSGTIGDITCFSFYATKTITTGEGGMATTENSEWADRMRIMGLHGINKDAWKRYTSINPVVGGVVHAIRRRYDPDQIECGIGHEEAKRLWDKEVKDLLAESRLQLAENIPFVFGLNRLYIAEKDRTGGHQP